MPVNYKSPEINYAKRRKSIAIPDQSLSIQEIVKRYVRGVPVDIVQRKGVYVDQDDHDLEKLSRMDFGEKAEYAAALAEDAKRLQSELSELERSHSEAKAKQASEAAAKASKAIEDAAERAAKQTKA